MSGSCSPLSWVLVVVAAVHLPPSAVPVVGLARPYAVGCLPWRVPRLAWAVMLLTAAAPLTRTLWGKVAEGLELRLLESCLVALVAAVTSTPQVHRQRPCTSS